MLAQSPADPPLACGQLCRAAFRIPDLCVWGHMCKRIFEGDAYKSELWVTGFTEHPGLSSDVEMFSSVVFTNLYSHKPCMKYPVLHILARTSCSQTEAFANQVGGQWYLCCFNSYFLYY